MQEFAELESLSRAETGALKNFCSIQYDLMRDPYGRVTSRVPRRLVFTGTVNEFGFLKDSTGNRRFWPLTVQKPIDVPRLRADRDQLWAEAAALEAKGVSLVLPKALWAEAGKRQLDETSEDPWADIVRRFLQGRERTYVKDDERDRN